MPQTRTPGCALFTEVRYKGTKTIAITPDYSEVAKLCDQWLAPKQGTDSALAMAMGHVILKEFHLDNPSDYFLNYCRRYTDMPMLVCWMPAKMAAGAGTHDARLRPCRWSGRKQQSRVENGGFQPRWRTGCPERIHRFRWGEKANGTRTLAAGAETELSLSLLGQHDEVTGVAFPILAATKPTFRSVKQEPVLVRQLPVKHLTLADGSRCPVVSVYDLVLANYGLDRGLDDVHSAKITAK